MLEEYGERGGKGKNEEKNAAKEGIGGNVREQGDELGCLGEDVDVLKGNFFGDGRRGLFGGGAVGWSQTLFGGGRRSSS